MKTITCECGTSIDKEYRFTQYLNHKNYYRWQCYNCGQAYMEEAKEDIILE